MSNFMHELIKEKTGMSPDNRPWDYRVFWPTLNDEAVLEVWIKWKEDSEHEIHRFRIDLTVVTDGRTP